MIELVTKNGKTVLVAIDQIKVFNTTDGIINLGMLRIDLSKDSTEKLLGLMNRADSDKIRITII